MTLWLVRAGKYGQQEEGALKHEVVTIGWNELPSLANIKTKEDMADLYSEYYPDEKKRTAATNIGQVWRFFNEIQIGDLVALPLKTQSAIALGEVIEKYQYKELAHNIKHIRKVKWLKTLSRTAFDQDILYSLSSQLTVCKARSYEAEKRVKNLLVKNDLSKEEPLFDVEGESSIDIEEYAKDQIVKYIVQKFKGHGLERIVEAILKAQGYVTKRSAPGPDEGVDILASSGPLGFEPPRICVQVKSTNNPSDDDILRQLQGVMENFRAEQGLLVSLGGFTKKALRQARNRFFYIRLWDAGALLDEILKYYKRFDDELKAELPLKKFWSLVSENGL